MLKMASITWRLMKLTNKKPFSDLRWYGTAGDFKVVKKNKHPTKEQQKRSKQMLEDIKKMPDYAFTNKKNEHIINRIKQARKNSK